MLRCRIGRYHSAWCLAIHRRYKQNGRWAKRVKDKIRVYSSVDTARTVARRWKQCIYAYIYKYVRVCVCVYIQLGLSWYGFSGSRSGGSSGCPGHVNCARKRRYPFTLLQSSTPMSSTTPLADYTTYCIYIYNIKCVYMECVRCCTKRATNSANKQFRSVPTHIYL